MKSIQEKLQRALAEEGRPPKPSAPPRPLASETGEKLAPIAVAARQLADEVAHVPEIRFTISPEAVWIELYDRHLFFGFDPKRNLYIADEIDHSWLDRDVREESYSWEKAEDCVDAMVRFCARYLLLARALHPDQASEPGR